MRRDVDVVALLRHLYAQPTEGVGDDPQLVVVHVLDAQVGACHGGHTDKTAHLDHVRKHRVRRPPQRAHALHGQQVRTHPRDLRPHADQHRGELLDVGFARRIVDRRHALGHDGRHEDIGRPRQRGFVEQHIGATELFGPQLSRATCRVIDHLCAELAEAQDVRVEAPSPDLVTAHVGQHSPTEACQQRPGHHHRPAQRSRSTQKVVRLQIVQVHRVRLKRVRTLRHMLHLHAHVGQQADQVGHVQNVGHVPDLHLLARQQRGADHLQRLILGPLRRDLTPHPVPPLNHERAHFFLRNFLLLFWCCAAAATCCSSRPSISFRSPSLRSISPSDSCAKSLKIFASLTVSLLFHVT